MEITVKHEYTAAQLPILATFLTSMGSAAAEAPPASIAPEPRVVQVVDKAEVVSILDAPRRTRRTKAEMEADKAAEQPKVESAPEPAKIVEAPVAVVEPAKVETQPVADAAPSPTTAVPTAADALKALEGLLAKKGMPVCLGVLGQYGITSVSKLPEDKRAEFIAKCAAAGEAA